MKDDIQLIEYFTEKGWSLNPKQLQLMVASYNLGINDAKCNLPEGDGKE